MMDVPRGHRVVATTTGHNALKRIDAPALRLAEAARAAHAIRRFGGLFFADYLGQLEQLCRNHRLILSFHHAILIGFRDVVQPFILTVDLNFADVTAVAKQITDAVK